MPKESSSEDEKEAFNPFMPSNLIQENKTTTTTSADEPKNDIIPLNLSKPRREEPNNNKEQDITTTSVSPPQAAFEEELNNLEMLRKRKYFLDNKFSAGPSPLFPPIGPLKTADYGAKLHPGLFPTPTSASADFPYAPFRNFPAAAAVGMLGPPIGQPAGLAALRGSPMGLHQVSMIDQVRQEHQRQQQQQQQHHHQQQPQQSTEDGISTRKSFLCLEFL